MAGPVLEEWLNEVLKTDDKSKMVPQDVQERAAQFLTPAQAYGIDLNSLITQKVSLQNAKRI